MGLVFSGPSKDGDPPPGLTTSPALLNWSLSVIGSFTTTPENVFEFSSEVFSTILQTNKETLMKTYSNLPGIDN